LFFPAIIIKKKLNPQVDKTFAEYVRATYGENEWIEDLRNRKEEWGQKNYFKMQIRDDFGKRQLAMFDFLKDPATSRNARFLRQ
jgi:hypothetical protein